MITKTQLIAFIVALGLIVGFVLLGLRHTTPKADIAQQQAEWPSREIEKVDVSDKGAFGTITAVYPKTASDSITKYFDAFVQDQIAQFKNDVSWVEDQQDSAQAEALSLDIAYTMYQGTSVQTYVFTVASYTGGAHGMQVRKTFAFNKEGQLLTISNVFKNGFDGLPVFAKVVQKALLKREGVQADWLTEGASPIEENYNAFIVQDDGVTVLFDPYEVAPYVFGPIDVFIPASDFGSIANPALFALTAKPTR